MLHQWLSSIVDLFYPNTCVSCGRELVGSESQICTFCRWDIPFTDYQFNKENYVAELFSGRVPFENACALFFFRNGSDRYRGLIHKMKYSSRRDVAYLMGEIFGEELLKSDHYKDIDLLVPIPLHWTKRVIRGYNQSEELCRGMSASMGVPCDFSSVSRTRITAQQARRKRQERWKNVSGAFAVKSPMNLEGKHVLLIDDVLTSGSTIESCASEMIKRVEDIKLSIAVLSVAKRSSKHRSPRIADQFINDRD